MKKNIYVGIFVAGTILLTGCGSKTLECTRENNYSDEMKMNQTVKATFEKKHVTKLSMNMDIELGENYLEYKDELKTSVEDEFANLKDAKGIEYSTKDTTNGFTFQLDADINKLDQTTKENLDLINTEQSYDDAKAEFESEGYTCK